MFIFPLVVASVLAATPPADRMIEVAGLNLHIACDGRRRAGAPLVLLEAGAGNDLTTWDRVRRPIASFARVCAYDRPGMGTSGRAPQPQPADQIVETLHALLRAAGERPPYVMAGHSYGGMIVRLFAARYPAEVTGLVLIDSSHETQMTRFAAVPPGPSAAAAPMPEQIDFAGMSAALAKAPWHADIPLVVLTRTDRPAAAGDSVAAARGQIWQELQRELATRSPQAEHIVAANSGHYIQNDEPPLVIEAVRRVADRAARRR